MREVSPSTTEGGERDAGRTGGPFVDDVAPMRAENAILLCLK